MAAEAKMITPKHRPSSEVEQKRGPCIGQEGGIIEN